MWRRRGQEPSCIFCVGKFATVCNNLFGGSAAALGAISAHFEPAHDNVKTAIALDLTFETVEKIAFEFHDFAAPQACHVDVITLRASLVEMLLALHVHEIKFIDQTMALEQTERAIHSDAVNPGIQFACVAKNLRRIEVLLSRFHDREDGASLVSQAHAAGSQGSL